MKQLNIFELQNSINKKKQNRTNVYESVLEKCHMKIQTAANKEKYECYPKNKFIDIKVINNGGWHFTEIKTP